MKTFSIQPVARLLATLALMMGSASSFAASTGWTEDLVAACATNIATTTQTCTATPQINLSAWSTASGTTTAPTATATFSVASVYDWGASAGLGVVSSNEDSRAQGPHAMDNGYGIEAMLLNFTAGPVNLSSVKVGWNGNDNPCISANNGTGSCASTVTGSAINYNDSDMSIFAWTGSSGGPTMAGATLGTSSTTGLMAANSGWTLIGNYANVGSITSPVNTQNLPLAVYSSYWLISAYSTTFGSGTGLDGGNDSFKILSIAGNTCTSSVVGNACTTPSVVPEPGSLALVGAALMGFAVTRRRRQQKSI